MSDAAENVKALRNKYRSLFCNTGSGQISPAGKDVLANLKAMSGYGGSPFSADPVSMAYNVGMQDVVRHIFMMLNIPDSEIYRLTQSSNNEEDNFTYD